MKIDCRCTRKALLTLLAVLAATHAHAEDGYDLWLRYHPVADEAARAHYREAASEIVAAIPNGSEAAAGEAAPMSRPPAAVTSTLSAVASAGTMPGNPEARTTLGVAQAELV